MARPTPSPSSFASGEKKQGIRLAQHGNAIAMSDRSCQTMLSFPVSVQIRRRRNFNEVNRYGRDEYSTNCGRNKKSEKEQKIHNESEEIGRRERERQKAEKKIQLSVTIDSSQFPYFDRLVRNMIFVSFYQLRRIKPFRHLLFMQYGAVIIVTSTRFNSGEDVICSDRTLHYMSHELCLLQYLEWM